MLGKSKSAWVLFSQTHAKQNMISVSDLTFALFIFTAPICMFSFGREAHYNNPGGPIYYPNHGDYYSR